MTLLSARMLGGVTGLRHALRCNLRQTKARAISDQARSKRAALEVDGLSVNKGVDDAVLADARDLAVLDHNGAGLALSLDAGEVHCVDALEDDAGSTLLGAEIGVTAGGDGLGSLLVVVTLRSNLLSGSRLAHDVRVDELGDTVDVRLLGGGADSEREAVPDDKVGIVTRANETEAVVKTGDGSRLSRNGSHGAVPLEAKGVRLCGSEDVSIGVPHTVEPTRR